jgi:glutathionylspermidine synthase
VVQAVDDMDAPFFASLGFGYWQVGTQKYASLESVAWERLGIGMSRAAFSEFSIQTATALGGHLDVMRDYDSAELRECGYPPVLCDDLARLDWGEIRAMRLGYIVDTAGVPHLIEVNAQTPSFWWECETGSSLILEKLGLPHPGVHSPDLLASLAQMLADAEKYLGRKASRLGFVVGDAQEDVFQMKWLSQLVSQSDPGLEVEVLTISRLDVNKESAVPYSLNSSLQFDVLFLWYPLEWLATERFVDGVEVWPELSRGLSTHQWYWANGIASFIMQNKYFLADYCTQNPAQSAITHTVATLDEIQAVSPDQWIAKPIWGRQGMAVFGTQQGNEFYSDFSDTYYSNQWYAYQPFFSPTPFYFHGVPTTYTLEQWVYHDGSQWKAGGYSLRLNAADTLVSSDDSRWLVVQS